MKLWEDGKYVGWKYGKPWWRNHGPHVPISVLLPENKRITSNRTIICKRCRHELPYTPDAELTTKVAIITLTGDDGRTVLCVDSDEILNLDKDELLAIN